MIPNRKERLQSLMLQEISEMLLREIKDPRLETVSITEVDLSSDLKNAKIYFFVSGDENRRMDAKRGFDSARGFIRRGLLKRLNIRRVPDMMFIFDTSFDNASNINRLFQEINRGDEI